jgi:hypothetical protein
LRCRAARNKPNTKEMINMQTETIETSNIHRSRRQPPGRTRFEAFASTRQNAPLASAEGAPREAASSLRGALSGAPEEFVRNQGQPNGE